MRKKSAVKEKTDESTERVWKMRGERDGDEKLWRHEKRGEI